MSISISTQGVAPVFSEENILINQCHITATPEPLTAELVGPQLTQNEAFLKIMHLQPKIFCTNEEIIRHPCTLHDTIPPIYPTNIHLCSIRWPVPALYVDNSMNIRAKKKFFSVTDCQLYFFFEYYIDPERWLFVEITVEKHG